MGKGEHKNMTERDAQAAVRPQDGVNYPQSLMSNEGVELVSKEVT